MASKWSIPYQTGAKPAKKPIVQQPSIPPSFGEASKVIQPNS